MDSRNKDGTTEQVKTFKCGSTTHQRPTHCDCRHKTKPQWARTPRCDAHTTAANDSAGNCSTTATNNGNAETDFSHYDATTIHNGLSRHNNATTFCSVKSTSSRLASNDGNGGASDNACINDGTSTPNGNEAALGHNHATTIQRPARRHQWQLWTWYDRRQHWISNNIRAAQWKKHHQLKTSERCQRLLIAHDDKEVVIMYLLFPFQSILYYNIIVVLLISTLPIHSTTAFRLWEK